MGTSGVDGMVEDADSAGEGMEDEPDSGLGCPGTWGARCALARSIGLWSAHTEMLSGNSWSAAESSRPPETQVDQPPEQER